MNWKTYHIICIFFTFSVILLSHGQVIRSPLQPVIAKVGDNVSFTCDTIAGTNGSKSALVWKRVIYAERGEEDIAMYFKGVSILYLMTHWADIK